MTTRYENIGMNEEKGFLLRAHHAFISHSSDATVQRRTSIVVQDLKILRDVNNGEFSQSGRYIIMIHPIDFRCECCKRLM